MIFIPNQASIGVKLNDDAGQLVRRLACSMQREDIHRNHVRGKIFTACQTKSMDSSFIDLIFT
jgi:hypothetical protein